VSGEEAARVISINKRAGVKGTGLPESTPLHSKLQQDGQGKVLVVKRNVTFGAGTSMDFTGTKGEKTRELINMSRLSVWLIKHKKKDQHSKPKIFHLI